MSYFLTTPSSWFLVLQLLCFIPFWYYTKKAMGVIGSKENWDEEYDKYKRKIDFWCYMIWVFMFAVLGAVAAEVYIEFFM